MVSPHLGWELYPWKVGERGGIVSEEGGKHFIMSLYIDLADIFVAM